MRLIFDSHLDLAWNALSFNRDLLAALEQVRREERDTPNLVGCGCGTVTLPEMRRGGVAVCVGTLLVRTKRQVNGSLRTDLDFRTQEIAYALAQGQLAYYRLLERLGHVRMIASAKDLQDHWQCWTSASDERAPIGIILSMEGADPIVNVEQLTDWWNDGLRVIGLSHYGQGIYAAGTHGQGGLTDRGPALLREMQRLGFVLDLTHTTDDAFFQALEHFHGPVLASHQNCRALVPGVRQMSDEQLRCIIDRGGIVGAVLDNWMLTSEFEPTRRGRDRVTLANVVDQIEHVCQLAGNCEHAAIGSDLDGGFGTEQSPADLDSIADLQKLADLLASRGYTDPQIDQIFHGNWRDFFMKHLPKA